MRILAFETAVAPGSVAVLAGDVGREALLSGAHSRDLLPAADRLLAELALDRRALELALVGTGPGSFTGLRVAAAAALGLALGLAIPCRGVPSFDAAAFASLAPGETGWLAVDARRSEVYLACYRRSEQDVEVLEPPRVATLAEARALFARVPLAPLACAAELAGALSRPDARALAAPGAAVLARLAARRVERGGLGALGAPNPLYLRTFQAGEPRR
jgi:tRNA threonylcarbamoyladenosine biosynthesis protein TsaB